MILTLESVKAVYEPLRNEENSLQMTRYMKYQFPFLGIKKSASAPLNRNLFSTYELPREEALKLLVQQLFLEDEREYHYFAMRLLNKQKHLLSSADLPFVESLLLQSSWWDSIDDISPNIVGHLVKQDSALESDMMRWAESDNFWLQRAALLHQLKFKKDMNIALMEQMIERLQDEREFFIRKAIGWLLREYSKTDAAFVQSYVERTALSNLSKREALKWLAARQSK